MQLTVLGSAGSYPGPERACSSYLLEADGYRLLVDCGNGSMSNLLRVCNAADIDALLLSHEHPDHWADTVALYCARRYHVGGPQPLPVFGPAGVDTFIGRVMSHPHEWSRIFPFAPVAAGDRLELGPIDVEFFAANHPVETLAARFSVDGTVLTYSGDSGPTDQLISAARDADLFIADCSWPTTTPDMPPDMHMTGAQAGLHSARAAAKALLVTHVLPIYEPQVLAAEAAEHFDGRIYTADDLQVITFSPEGSPNVTQSNPTTPHRRTWRPTTAGR